MKFTVIHMPHLNSHQINFPTRVIKAVVYNQVNNYGNADLFDKSWRYQQIKKSSQ